MKETSGATSNRDTTKQENTREFVVISDTDFETRANVLTANDGTTRIPVPGEPLESTFAIAQEFVATQEKGGANVWRVVVTYRIPGNSQDSRQNDQQSQPELEAPEVRVYDETEERTIYSGWFLTDDEGTSDERALTNSAGCFYPEPTTTTFPVAIVELTRNQPENIAPISLIQTWVGKICKNTVFGVPNTFAQITAMNYQKVFRLFRWSNDLTELQTFWKETITFRFRRPRKILDQGDFYRDDDGNLQPSTMLSGGKGRVMLLDGTGKPLNGDGTTNGMATPVFSEEFFDTQPTDFDSLNLPATLLECRAVIYITRTK